MRKTRRIAIEICWQKCSFYFWWFENIFLAKSFFTALCNIKIKQKFKLETQTFVQVKCWRVSSVSLCFKNKISETGQKIDNDRRNKHTLTPKFRANRLRRELTLAPIDPTKYFPFSLVTENFHFHIKQIRFHSTQFLHAFLSHLQNRYSFEFCVSAHNNNKSWCLCWCYKMNIKEENSQMFFTRLQWENVCTDVDVVVCIKCENIVN